MAKAKPTPTMPEEEREPVLDEVVFRKGMTALSANFDYEGISPLQVQARMDAYWPEVDQYRDGIWTAAVRHLIRTRASTPRPDGTLVRPSFPPVGDLIETMDALRAQTALRLPEPDIVPAPVETARAYIRRIREQIREARGPLFTTPSTRPPDGTEAAPWSRL